MTEQRNSPKIVDRFRGFLPVVVDLETAGFNPSKDALLEIAAVVVGMDEKGHLYQKESVASNVEPFPGANLDEKSLAFNGIDPWHPFRLALPESDALEKVFTVVQQALEESGCSRAILVGHNPMFDLSFLNAAIKRCRIKSPFHSFSSFDTCTLSAIAYGQTVLARAIQAAELDWNEEHAHSAAYDTERTAALFCTIMNQWQTLQPFSAPQPAEQPA